MSDFTIEQLEALKEGTCHAPWRPEYDEGEDHWVIAFDHPKFGGRWDMGIAHGEGTANAFAAAPALVDALIAEKRAHAKLREELEAMKSAFEDRPSPHDDHLYTQGWDYALDLVDTELARILEATDE